jgi:hypothetical protein
MLCCLLALGLATTSGCQTMRILRFQSDRPEKEGPAVAKKTDFHVAQFHFLADFEINRHLPIFHELAELREHVYRDLQLPSSNTIVKVHLFEDRERYERFMRQKYPDLPQRRAFFVAQPRGPIGGGEDLLVYTYWGDRIHQDLRHELTHALLHSVLKDVPLWLDEGLAEYYELPPGWKGVNYQHLAHFKTNGQFRPNLERLEQLTKVEQMTPAEYREAWAWVHLMLHGSAESKKLLVAYLKELRTQAQPRTLRPRLAALCPALDVTLQRHLTRLDSNRPQVSVTPDTK